MSRLASRVARRGGKMRDPLVRLTVRDRLNACIKATPPSVNLSKLETRSLVNETNGVTRQYSSCDDDDDDDS